MRCILLFFTVERGPVPNEGACDWGINSFLGSVAPTCEICKWYYDGRTDSSFAMQDCVWAPIAENCYAKNYAVAENLVTYETCEDMPDDLNAA